jgi:hypothetical protein
MGFYEKAMREATGETGEQEPQYWFPTSRAILLVLVHLEKQRVRKL